MASQKHVHKYHFLKNSDYNYDIWACAYPDCSHHMPPYMINTLRNRPTICWNCGNETPLNPFNTHQPNPICIKCSLIKGTYHGK